MGLQLSCVRKLSKAGNESGTALLLFWCGGSRSPGSLCTKLPHRERSRVIVGAISVSTVRYNVILWDLQWPSACPNLIVGAVLLAYGSNPTQRERVPPPCLPPLCTEQRGLWWVSVLHCQGGCFAMMPTKVSASYLQYRMGLWTLQGRENKAGRNTPAHIAFQHRFLNSSGFSSKG